MADDSNKITRPLVSVIIPNYNYAKYLPQCLQSVFAQTYQAFEIIIIDDCSTDSSQVIYDGLSQNQQVTVLKNPVNSGVVFSRNRGIAAANGDYLAFLDPDDEWLPEKLSKQMAALINKNCDIACSSILIIDEAGRHIGLRKPLFTNITYANFLKSNSIPHSSVLIKKRWLQQVGYSEVVNPFYGRWLPQVGKWKTLIHEDYALLLQLLKQGATVCYIDEPLVLYRKHLLSYSGSIVKKVLSIYVIFRRQQRFSMFTAGYYTARLMFLGLIKNRQELI